MGIRSTEYYLESISEVPSALIGMVFSQLAALPDGRWKASANGHARMDYPTTGKRSKAGLATAFDCPNDEGSWWESDCHPPRSGLQRSNVSLEWLPN